MHLSVKFDTIIEVITRTEIHYWRRNEDGGLDLYYDDMGDCKEKKTFIVDSLIACSIVLANVIAAIVFLTLEIPF